MLEAGNYNYGNDMAIIQTDVITVTDDAGVALVIAYRKVDVINTQPVYLHCCNTNSSF
jgi:hypothetical protein